MLIFLQNVCLDFNQIFSNMTLKNIVVTPNSDYVGAGEVKGYRIGNLCFFYFSDVAFKTDIYGDWETIWLWQIDTGVEYTVFTLSPMYCTEFNGLRLHFNNKKVYLHYDITRTGVGGYFGAIICKIA